MNKTLLNIILCISLLSNHAFADCDWSKIQHNNDGTYTYTAELHVCVGQMKEDLSVAQQQNADLTKAIELKDLAITKSDQRADLWMNTSLKLEDRIRTIDSMSKTNDYLYFGLGILTVFVAGYAVRQAYGR